MRIDADKKNHVLRKLNEEKLKAILNDIRGGSPYKIAAEANGISDRHFYDMLLQGVCDLESDKQETLYARLAQGIRQIERDEINECRDEIRASGKGHVGKQWTLERVYWKYYGQNAAAIEFDERLRKLEQGDKNHEEESEQENNA